MCAHRRRLCSISLFIASVSPLFFLSISSFSSFALKVGGNDDEAVRKNIIQTGNRICKVHLLTAKVNTVYDAKGLSVYVRKKEIRNFSYLLINYNSSICLYFAYLAPESSFASLKSFSAYSGKVRFNAAYLVSPSRNSS